MEGEKPEMLTWKFMFLSTAAYIAALAAWQLLFKSCCRMDLLFPSDYTAVRAAWQELQPFCFLTECVCVGLD